MWENMQNSRRAPTGRGLAGRAFTTWLSLTLGAGRFVCVCVGSWGNEHSCGPGVPEGECSQAVGEGRGWKFRSLYLRSFVQFSNNPDELPGPDGHPFIQPCCVTFCMQMKCPHSKRALGRVQNETAHSTPKVINLEPREEAIGGWQYCFLVCPGDLILIHECESNCSLIDVLWNNLVHKYVAEEANKWNYYLIFGLFKQFQL